MALWHLTETLSACQRSSSHHKGKEKSTRVYMQSALCLLSTAVKISPLPLSEIQHEICRVLTRFLTPTNGASKRPAWSTLFRTSNYNSEAETGWRLKTLLTSSQAYTAFLVARFEPSNTGCGQKFNIESPHPWEIHPKTLSVGLESRVVPNYIDARLSPTYIHLVKFNL